jgi:hypothetical protein
VVLSRCRSEATPASHGQNLSAWMSKIHQFFNYYDTPDYHRFMVASYHMEGKALTWLEEMKIRGVFTIFTNWNTFVREIQIRFGHHHEIVGVTEEEQE